jgi:D-aminopeptidase
MNSLVILASTLDCVNSCGFNISCQKSTMIKAYKTPSGKLRARALGIAFDGDAGPLNAITDVAGLQVGYSTIIAGPARTGVTAILPRGRDGIGLACAAGYHSFNGNGEMTGVSWINEAGSFSTPVMITNTHAVGTVHRGVIDWVTRHLSKKAEEWLLPVVAETWDGYLNDINGPHLTGQHAIDAINAAAGGAIEEGSVGGGTGMNCYGFKGGNGTASRVIDYGDHKYTVGVFLQANFGARHELTIAGDKIGRRLLSDNPVEDHYSGKASGAGSCIGIVATDAPMLPGQLNAMARRVALGLARTGTTGSHFSGDIFLAFSTANEGAFDSGFPDRAPSLAQNRHADFVPWNQMDDFYAAVVHGTEEAVLNAMVANSEMIGFEGHRSPALPHDAVREATARR